VDARAGAEIATAAQAAAIHLSNVKARVDGDAAIVHGVSTLLKPDGTVVAAVDFMDMFKYRNGRWVAVGAQETLRR
jgi:hypothetical protein